ncbi:unnamed protein product, partial [Polarella glacialis]
MISRGGLELMWGLLDGAFDKLQDEKFEDAEERYNDYRRPPGCTMELYCQTLKRYKLEYLSQDKSVISDRAFAQRMLNRAGLSKSQRHTVFFNAGAVYEALQIEKVLKSRHGALMADGAEEEGEEEDEDLEQEFDEDGDEGESDDADEADEDASLTASELQEAWAAGWQAKSKTAFQRKNRGFVKGKPGEATQSSQDDPRKKNSICSSCGNKGHWKGDIECPKVKDGTDKAHVPKRVNDSHFAHFIGGVGGNTASLSGTLIIHGSFQAPSRRDARWKEERDANAAAPLITTGENEIKKSFEKERAMARMAMLKQLQEIDEKEDEASEEEFLDPDISECESSPWSVVGSSKGYAKPVMSSGKPKAHAPPPPPEMCRPTHRSPPVHPGKGGAASKGIRFEKFSHEELLELLEVMDPEGRRDLMKYLMGQTQSEDRPRATATSSSAASSGGYVEGPAPKHVPSALKKKQTDQLRRQLYYDNVSTAGKLQPSRCADVTNKAQHQCLHKLEDLLWGSNTYATWARCGRCDLKHAIYYDRKTGECFMTVVSAAFVAALVQPGEILADSGCRMSVGGQQWHDAYQERLTELNIPFKEEVQDEYFKFGAGPVIRTVESADDMGRCQMTVNYWERTYKIGWTDWKPLCYTESGHPKLGLLEFSTRHLQQLARPQRNYVVYDEDLASDSGTDSNLPELVDSSEDERDHYYYYPDSQSTAAPPSSDEGSSITSDTSYQLLELLETTAATSGALRDKKFAVDSDEEFEQREEDLQDLESVYSETSHEDGLEDPQDVEEPDSEEEESAAHFIGHSGEETDFAKSGARKVQTVLKEIHLAFQECEEKTARKAARKSRGDQQGRRPGPWRILEIFTWTCMVSMIAFDRGWETYEPLTLPGWDLFKESTQRHAMDYVRRADPDFIMMAWPCSPWSRMQRSNMRTPQQTARLMKKRQEHRALLAFILRITRRQRRNRRAFAGENPADSLAWRERPIQAAFQGCGDVVTDACCWNKRRPDTGRLVRKPTRIKGSAEICEAVNRCCPGGHEHSPTEGKMKIKVRGHTRTIGISEWSGGYTKEFAGALLEGAEQALRTAGVTPSDLETVREAFATGNTDDEEGVSDQEDTSDAGEGIPEERYMNADENSVEFDVDDSEVAADAPEAIIRCGDPSPQSPRTSTAWYLYEDAEVGWRELYCGAICQELEVPNLPGQAGTGPGGQDLCQFATFRFQPRYPHRPQASYVARHFYKSWIVHYGMPAIIVHDQGGEFQKEFIQALEQWGVASKVTAAHAGWQLVIGERAGGVLGAINSAVVHQHAIADRKDMAMSLAVSVQAKNSLLRRHGYSPEQAVFGRSVRWEPGNINSDDAGLASLSAPVSPVADFVPGTQVYFYQPLVGRGRRRTDPGAWRGPATVITKESSSRYYVSWRGRCLLVAAEQLRLASAEEAAQWHYISVDARLCGERVAETKQYEETTQQPEEKPDNVPEALELLERKNRAIKVKNDKLKRKALPPVSPLRQETPSPAVVEPVSLEGPPRESPQEEAVAGQAGPVEEELNVQRKRRILLDDLPEAIRRAMESPLAPNLKRGRFDMSNMSSGVGDSLPLLTMVASLDDGQLANRWLTREELRALRRVLKLPVTAARSHVAPRRRLMKSVTARNRLTILVGQDQHDVFVLDDESEVGRRKMPMKWRGLTIYYRKEEQPKMYEAYLTLPDGTLGATKMRKDDLKEMQKIQPFLLKLKASGKELDPRFFDQTEAAAFLESDKQEWSQWIRNNTVRILTPAEASKIPRRLIFAVPLRMVRTNKGKTAADAIQQLLAKSRLVAPGHLDPQLGEFRTDAPTTTPVAVSLAATIAASLCWKAYLFDVATAFLSGKATEREVYVRAPKEGLPAADGQPSVSPFQLKQVLKSIYGLAEAPRLWYLQARSQLEKCGYQELKLCRATFLLQDPRTGLVESICCLHVDDGFLVGNFNNPAVQKAKEYIDQHFNIKEWIDLQAQSHDYLGEKTTQHEDYSIATSMQPYIEKLEPLPVMKGDPDERELNDEERSTLRSLVMKLFWPARKMMSQILYGVSNAAQEVNQATVKTAKVVNDLVKYAKAEATAGRAQKTYRAIDLSDPLIVTYFDASFANETGGKSQAGMFAVVTDRRALDTATAANEIEKTSNKISRVVRSTMAAEASLNVPGVMVTDARSLYDHLTTTGSIPSERQTMLDLLCAKEMIETAQVSIRWVPTQRQLADHLTKTMQCKLLVKFLSTGLIALSQTISEQKVEAHKAELRKGQRQRRKAKMKAQTT